MWKTFELAKIKEYIPILLKTPLIPHEQAATGVLHFSTGFTECKFL